MAPIDDSTLSQIISSRRAKCYGKRENVLYCSSGGKRGIGSALFERYNGSEIDVSAKRPLPVRPALLLCVAGLASGAATADALAIEATAVSEVAYRGVSETFARPAIGCNVEWAGMNGAHAGLSFLEGRAPAVRQRERSVNLYLGWQTEFAKDWMAATSIGYRAFPESTKEWNFVEYQVAIGWEDKLSLELAWSPNYYDHNTESLAVAVRGFQPLSRSFYVSAELGAVDLSWRDISGYRYGSVAIGLRHDRWLAELSHTRATDEGLELFGAPLETPGLLLELSYLLR